MSFLPNVFSDPALRARQDQLNSQWVGLNDTIGSCGLTASSAPAFQQFYADFAAWQEFYGSGSDYTTASKHATDEWQDKLKEYTRTLLPYCSIASPDAGGDAYIPGVKDNPADEPSLLDKLGDEAGKPFLWVEDVALKVGIGLIIVVVLILGTLVYVSTKGKVKAGAHGVELGGG
jgi:hypothetical protein